MGEQRLPGSKVVTVTLNPSLDRTLITQFLAIGNHNRVREDTRLDPAGRGMSISRALHSLDIPTHAILLIGNDPIGRAYQSLLVEEQFPVTVLRRDGQTRSDTIILDTGHKNETRIIEESTGVTHEDLENVIKAMKAIIEPGDRVVFAGSLPGDLPVETYTELIRVAHEDGGHVAINAGGGDPLSRSLEARPELIYLTQNQAEAIFNYPVRAYADVVTCAQYLRERGAGKVIITLSDAASAVLVTNDGSWQVDLPDVGLVGTRSGHAEAMIAGYLAGRVNEQSPEESLGLGAAASAFTQSQVGHEYGSMKDVEEISEQVNVTPVEGDDDEPGV